MTGELLAVYGTLRRGGGGWRELPAGQTTFLTRCVIPGRLFTHGPYPTVRLDPAGEVIGDLFRIAPELLPALDAYEREGELYLRRQVPLTQPVDVTAWVYLDATEAALPEIPGGDWLR